MKELDPFSKEIFDTGIKIGFAAVKVDKKEVSEEEATEIYNEFTKILKGAGAQLQEVPYADFFMGSRLNVYLFTVHNLDLEQIMVLFGKEDNAKYYGVIYGVIVPVFEWKMHGEHPMTIKEVVKLYWTPDKKLLNGGK